jgi:fused signal recognition particle receptor
MALKDLWGKLTGRKAEAEAEAPPPAITLPEPVSAQPPLPTGLWPSDLELVARDTRVIEPPPAPVEPPAIERPAPSPEAEVVARLSDPAQPAPVTPPPVGPVPGLPPERPTPEQPQPVPPAPGPDITPPDRQRPEIPGGTPDPLPEVPLPGPGQDLPSPGAPPPAVMDAPTPAPTGGGFFTRLRAGLSRSTQRLTESLSGLFTKRKLDDAALEELEETLITADLGVAAAGRIVAQFRRTRFGKEVTDEEVKAALAEEIAAILEPVAKPLAVDAARRPFTILVVGVNGTGKTTTIAKLGQQFREEGRSVIFAAGDTFRAAAVEQLQVWGDRTGATVVAPAKQGADSAGLAFDALQRAQRENTDILLIDTAGRLHNKSALMEELRKTIRVIKRLDESAPHAVLLVLDATTGQNATQQCKVFGEMVNVTGLVVTKLDGSAKGGIVVALAQEFGLPVHAVGVGEKAADLRPFEARDFARSLVGLG